MKHALPVVSAVLTLMSTAFAPPALAQQPPRTDRAFVVPVPRAVTLDGDLQEWDLSGAIESIYQPALAPRYTVRVAFMHDRDALYSGAHFVDDSPLMNRHDPRVETNLGWAGDCLQVRLSSDPALGYPHSQRSALAVGQLGRGESGMKSIHHRGPRIEDGA
ncbi:MAG: hypothetical protein M3347_03280 [Armatimonadota bacterium]|nr:hypothetical protein [Armatimonadota bacterium]